MLIKDMINDKNGFFRAMNTDLAERIRDVTFNGVNYEFDVEDSCAGTFKVQILRDRAERGSLLWRVAVCGIFPDGSGRTLSHFIFKGTLDEVVEYISSDKAMREICDDVSSIDDSIKKHD